MISVKLYCEPCDKEYTIEVESLMDTSDSKCPLCDNSNTFIRDIQVDWEYSTELLQLGNNSKPKAWG